jgi:hypothetical protein
LADLRHARGRSAENEWINVLAVVTSCHHSQRAETGSDDEKQDHGDDERQQAEKFGRGEADEQTTLLAVGGRRIAQSAFEELSEHIAHAQRGKARTDSSEASTDHLCGFSVHFRNSFE